MNNHFKKIEDFRFAMLSFFFYLVKKKYLPDFRVYRVFLVLFSSPLLSFQIEAQFIKFNLTLN
jgi:hypothetical protein